MKKRMNDTNDASVITFSSRSERNELFVGFFIRNSIPYSSVAIGNNARKMKPMIEPIFSYSFMGSGWYLHSLGDMIFDVQFCIFLFSA